MMWANVQPCKHAGRSRQTCHALAGPGAEFDLHVQHCQANMQQRMRLYAGTKMPLLCCLSGDLHCSRQLITT
jgi:hypothetical protein